MKNTREHMNALLRDLGGKIKLGDLALDDQGAISLAIDGETFTLQYHEGGEAYFVHRLGLLPAEDGPLGPSEIRAAVSAWLLDRNCFFRGTGPGSLGVNPERGGGDAIWYCARLLLDNLEYADFEAFLLAVADTSGRLRRELAELTGRGIPESRAADTENADNFLRV